MKPLRMCPTAGCCGLWDGVSCTVCDRKPKLGGWKDDKIRGTMTDRGYGYDWQKLRVKKLKRNQFCELCLKDDRVVPAIEVHHIKPFKGRRDPLRLMWSNLQSLCEECHGRITRERSREGHAGRSKYL